MSNTMIKSIQRKMPFQKQIESSSTFFANIFPHVFFLLVIKYIIEFRVKNLTHQMIPCH